MHIIIIVLGFFSAVGIEVQLTVNNSQISEGDFPGVEIVLSASRTDGGIIDQDIDVVLLIIDGTASKLTSILNVYYLHE